MDSSAYALIPVCSLFVLTAAFALREILQNRRLLKSDPEIASSSAGWEMRKRFHLFLFLALILRTVSILFEIFFKENASPDHHHGNKTSESFFGVMMSGGDVRPKRGDPADLSPTDGWMLAVLHTIPSLFFLTTYSLLILFWAQLYYAAWGGSYSSLRPLFYLSNAIIYIAFVSVAAYTIADPHASREDFRTSALYILGITYFICAAFMVYYGSRVAAQLRPRSRSSGTTGSYTARKMVLRRVTLLCAVCATVFCLRSAYCFVALYSSWSKYEGYPPSVNHDTFDAIFYVLMELIPGIFILVLTRQHVGGDAGDISETVTRVSEEDGFDTDGTEDYPPVYMPPVSSFAER